MVVASDLQPHANFFADGVGDRSRESVGAAQETGNGGE